MYCHIGNGPDLLGPLWRVVKETQVPIQTFLPTHMERSEALINDGANWVKAGGYVDFTCRTLKVFFLSRCVCLSVAFSLSLSLSFLLQYLRGTTGEFFRPFANLILSIL
jgi:beta-aspartyl-dipeptidase (metallo-type)